MTAGPAGLRPYRSVQGDVTSRLRTATGGWHAAVEHQLNLPDSVGDLADYLRLLAYWRRVWGIGGAVLAAAAPEALPRTSPVEALDADLAELAGWRGGVDAGPRASGSVRPVAGPVPGSDPAYSGLPSTGAGVWGVGYVLQGSRLGGQFVAPALRERLGLPAGTGMRFLLADGGDVGADWAEFRVRLRAVAPDPCGDRADAVLAGALAAFGMAAVQAAVFGWPAGAPRPSLEPHPGSTRPRAAIGPDRTGSRP